MTDKHVLASWIKRFLLEFLPVERNFARNTQASYRDTIRLLVVFFSTELHKKPDELLIGDLTADGLRKFLSHIEEHRRCSIRTRNQRLAAVHTFAQFVGERNPECLAWCAAIRTVSFKRSARVPVTYLEKDEIDALLKTPDQSTFLGNRDHTLLLFLYNSGARADEAARLTMADLNLQRSGSDGNSSVRLLGKGNKVRFCPLWASTVSALRRLTNGRTDAQRVFLNRCAQPMTRFGVHDVVTKHARSASAYWPRLRKKRISPHTIRHTTATHLLRAGVDINTTRAWLGHVSIETTNIYAETDLEMKARALAMCEVSRTRNHTRWRDKPDLLAFLQKL
jgi:integrase/recombinase XerD